MANEQQRGELVDKLIKYRASTPPWSRAAGGSALRRWWWSATATARLAGVTGKANEVPPSVEKAVKDGSRRMVEFAMQGGTIPHQVYGDYGALKVILVPAAPGTGVIAGEAVGPCCKRGRSDILTKCYGSTNPINLIKATFDALYRCGHARKSPACGEWNCNDSQRCSRGIKKHKRASGSAAASVRVTARPRAGS